MHFLIQVLTNCQTQWTRIPTTVLFLRGQAILATQLEFGAIVPDIQSHAQYLQLTLDVDYGTITTPVGFTSDIGTIV